ncbi:uncharacterized protein LOC120286661 [Eucalyptus grandis]|uniref:uncharacterized protein LOC120286661 n=1 Tax=Eucalyptus grandis TaxID=71139 RepID=UPI00192EA4E0|nr:uncharacterized protein LOC120286661 [Eucalyptus grandis]
MGEIAKEANGYHEKPVKPVSDVDSGQDKGHGDVEEDSEVKSLLPPRRGGMIRSSEKTRRKVQWNDSNGNSLTEVLEFQPSEPSDSDDDDNDSCVCTIM